MNAPRLSTKRIVLGLVAVSTVLSVFHILSPWSLTLQREPTRWKNIYVALNLRNNEDLIPGMASRFDELFSLLENSAKINYYFSIFSNNNSDRTDEFIIEYFKPLLDNRKIPNKITTNGKTCGGYSKPPPHMNRIDWLSCVRNSAMDPFYEKGMNVFGSSLAAETQNTLVLFFNDIVFSPSDIVNLINTDGGEYDLACGLDFYYNFYDIWVTRGIDGKYFSAFPPFAMDFVSGVRMVKSVSPIVGSLTEGVPVRCCWNGVAAIKASNFFEKNIRFRSEISEECHTIQSECKLFCEDLGENAKIVINPNVIVAYSEYFFWLNKLIRNFIIYSIFFLFRFFEFRFYIDETVSEMQCEGETKTSFASMVWVVVVTVVIFGMIFSRIFRKFRHNK